MSRTMLLVVTMLMILTGPAQASEPIMEAQILESREAPGRPLHGDDQVTVYLNGSGVVLNGGRGGSQANASRVVRSRSLQRVEIPPYRGGTRAWGEVVRCVKEVFSPFQLAVVTRRPARAPYIMAVVGGSSASLGLSASVTGIAPYSGRIIARAVVFAFERRDRGAEQICNTVVHEVGHALGLSHSYRRNDPMTYLSYGGRRSFQDAEVPCGGHRVQRCNTGRATQNTFQHLAQLVGLRRPGVKPAPVSPQQPDRRIAALPPRTVTPPPARPTVPRPPAPRPAPRTTPPAGRAGIRVSGPGSMTVAVRGLRVTIQTRSTTRRWTEGNRRYKRTTTRAVSCSVTIGGRTYNCTRSNGRLVHLALK